MAEHREGKLSPKTRTMLKFWRSVLYLLFSVLFYVVIVLSIARASSMAYEFTYEIFGSEVMEEAPGHDVEFTITKGEGTDKVAQELRKQRLVSNERTFYIRAKLTTDSAHPIMPGTYQLNTSMNYQQILDIITDSSKEAGQ